MEPSVDDILKQDYEQSVQDIDEIDLSNYVNLLKRKIRLINLKILKKG